MGARQKPSMALEEKSPAIILITGSTRSRTIQKEDHPWCSSSRQKDMKSRRKKKSRSFVCPLPFFPTFTAHQIGEHGRHQGVWPDDDGQVEGGHHQAVGHHGQTDRMVQCKTVKDGHRKVVLAVGLAQEGAQA
ncbi:hypothetical protein TYRP_021087 [Tyrophagus putrescentiae]|nr:hypothetical protein TYRP_021087 [Tyrophagus putrescentiae]